MPKGTFLLAFLAFAAPCVAQTPREPHTFFREFARFSPQEIAQIEAGRPLAKVLPSPSPETIYVGGAVYIHAQPEDYIRFARDIDRLRGISQYLAVGRFSDPPSVADLSGFEFEADDIKELRNCKSGDCGVQLPTELIAEFRSSIDWSRPDAAKQVNARARELAVSAIRRYRESGNQALRGYHDHDSAVNIADNFQSLIGARNIVGDYMPDLNRYLREYPRFNLPKAESVYFWERVNFGLKPTLRLNHLVSYRDVGPKGVADVVAVKQLYASHYFQVALDLSACVRDTGDPQRKGFYLITLKGSKQAGLTGLKGSILRKVVVSKTASSQEAALAAIKAMLEKKS